MARSPAPTPVTIEALPDAGALRRRLPGAALAAAAVVGAAIRLDQIGSQVIGDDEWHALHALLESPPSWILAHFGRSDHSIPLTLLDALAARTIGLSELWMRLPALAAGIAALVLLPRLLRPELGTKASVALAWLLAISPIHVYFSRYARPYSPAFLLAVVAVVALERWRTTRDRRWAAAWLAGSVLAPWFHLVFLPFVLAPLALAVLRRTRGALLLGLGTLAGLAVLLGPPLLADFGSLSDRSGGTAGAGLAPPSKVFELLTGANQPVLAFGFALALVLGLVAMRGRWSGVLGTLGLASLVQAAAVLAAAPAEIATPITTARYLLPALAFVLALAALGLERLDGLLKKEWRPVPRHAATAALTLALLVFGPLRAAHFRPNAFTNHTMYQYDYAPNFPHQFATRTLGLKGLPEFYARLAGEPSGGRSIVEAPWFYEWHRQPFALYQRAHRWPVLVGFVAREGDRPPLGELPWPDARFRFANFVHVADRRAMREKGVRYVVFHKDPPRPPGDDRHPSVEDARRWIEAYRAELGEPVAEDGDLCVFDLDAAR